MEDKNQFKVIISVGWKDCFIVKKNIKYINKNINPCKIYIITKKNLFFLFSKRFLKNNNFALLNEDTLVPGMTFALVKDIFYKKNPNIKNVGWYYQQFLKMGFALSEYADHRYLIWDADTIPTSKLTFIDNDKLLFAPKTEYHKPYFNVIYRLLKMKKDVDFSFIAEHMIIDSNIMKELISDVGSAEIYGSCWFEKIINSIDNDASNGFSEFETYGTYVINKYPNLYISRCLKTFRDAGKTYGRGITDKEVLSLNGKYDTISLELRDVPPFPKNMYHNFEKLLLWSVNKILNLAVFNEKK